FLPPGRDAAVAEAFAKGDHLRETVLPVLVVVSTAAVPREADGVEPLAAVRAQAAMGAALALRPHPGGESLHVVKINGDIGVAVLPPVFAKMREHGLPIRFARQHGHAVAVPQESDRVETCDAF